MIYFSINRLERGTKQSYYLFDKQEKLVVKWLSQVKLPEGGLATGV